MRDETPGFTSNHSPAVIIGPDLARVTAPVGWGDRAALSALRPALSRALAPPLPDPAVWPEHWRELHAERVAIAEEGGATDPEAVADGDLRLMYWRELCEMQQEMPEQVTASAA